MRRDLDQTFHCRLPLWSHVFGFRQLNDVVSGVNERDKLAAARQQDRIFKTDVSSRGRSFMSATALPTLAGFRSRGSQMFDSPTIAS
jgi:hypothetical protein